MMKTPFGRLNVALREFEFTSTHKCPMDSEGYHIAFPLNVLMKSMSKEGPIGLVAVYNEEESGQTVYLDEETHQAVKTEGNLRFKFALEFLRNERKATCLTEINTTA